MAKDNNLKDYLTNLGDAIRQKKGYPSSKKLNPQDFASEILSISTGGGRVNRDAVILGNGEEYNIFPQSNTFGAVSLSIDAGNTGVEIAGDVIIYVDSTPVLSMRFGGDGDHMITDWFVARASQGDIFVNGVRYSGETARLKWDQGDIEEGVSSDEIQVDIESATFET